MTRYLLICSILISAGAAAADGEAATRDRAKLVISNEQMSNFIVQREIVFPKYTTQIVNLANQNAQATRPKQIGQMSELIRAFPGKSYPEWVAWYGAQQPEAIDQATDKIMIMLANLRQAMDQIDRELVRAWVEDLVLTKTYLGLTYQEAILRTIAERQGMTWRLARPDEEARGVDGVIGDLLVSVKPTSYRTKAMLNETIDVHLVYYEKSKGGIRVFYDFE